MKTLATYQVLLCFVVGFGCKPRGADVKVPEAQESNADQEVSAGENEASTEEESASEESVESTPTTAGLEALLTAGETNGKWVMLNNAANIGSCLDFGINALVEGATSATFPCRRYQADNQAHRIVAVEGSSSFLIQSKLSGEWCLKATQATDAALVSVAKCKAADLGQHWTIKNSGGVYTFTNDSAKRSLQLGSGNSLQLAPQTETGKIQQWSVFSPKAASAAPAELVGPIFALKNVGYNTRCIDLTTAAEKVDLILTTCKTPAVSNQNFKLVATPIANAYLMQSSLSSSHCLKPDTTNNFTQVKSIKCDANDPSQRWFVQVDSANYLFVNDFMEGALHWGSADKLQVATVGTTENAQKWTIVKP